MKWYMRGDIHGGVTAIINFADKHPGDAIIILGDAGLNYYGGASDADRKSRLAHLPVKIYCVRGNHEKRPEDVPGMSLVYDGLTQGYCYWEEEYPNIFYFKDGEVYTINGKRTLVLGGAYSVDKWYRLACNYEWFSNEQLSCEEMNSIYEKYKGQHFDCVLSHTCPLGWQPTDLFLPFLDQNSVDNTMEVWMQEFSKVIQYDAWCFAHYHTNRDIIDSDVPCTYKNPHQIILFDKVINFLDIFTNKKIFLDKNN